nr:MAG TPA: hypothetical protein [Caudoviricetes sp.]
MTCNYNITYKEGWYWLLVILHFARILLEIPLSHQIWIIIWGL